MDEKKALGIAGGPVKCGNTDILLDHFLEGAKESGAETEKLYVYDLEIAPCNNCGRCWKSGVCPVKDGLGDIYRKLREADVIAIAAPVYFMGLPSQLKALIDRCQCIWVQNFIIRKGKFPRKRTGFFISTGASNYKTLFDGSATTVRSFFASIGAKYAGDLLVPGIEGTGEILKRPGTLKAVYRAGKKLAKG